MAVVILILCAIYWFIAIDLSRDAVIQDMATKIQELVDAGKEKDETIEYLTEKL